MVGTYLDEMAATRDRLDELVRAERPDVIHAHSPVLNVLPALSVGRSHGIPVVYEIRAFWEDAAVDHGTTSEGSLRYRLTRALETYAVRRVQGVAVICDGLRRDVESAGFRAERITVIPNAVDADQFAFDAPAGRGTASRNWVSTARPCSASSGPSTPTRASTCLLEALAQLLPRASRPSPAAGGRRARRRPRSRRAPPNWASAMPCCSPAACRTPKWPATTRWSTCWSTRGARCG